MLELVVDRGVRDVTAGRHVEIVEDQRLEACLGAVEGHRQMARMSAPADVAPLGKFEGKPRERGDPVIALLPGHRDMREIPALASASSGNCSSLAFDLLQAEHVRLVGAYEAFEWGRAGSSPS